MSPEALAETLEAACDRWPEGQVGPAAFARLLVERWRTKELE